MRTIFISYRRVDSEETVGRIYDRLVQKFGDNAVFKDVNNLQKGEKFDAQINETLKHCKVLIVVIGKNWLSSFKTDDHSGENFDFVKSEIERGLSNPWITVIPVLLGNTAMPARRDMPSSIADLAAIEAIRLRPDPDFKSDIQTLIQAVKNKIGSQFLSWNRLWKIAAAAVVCIGIFFLAMNNAAEGENNDLAPVDTTDTEPLVDSMEAEVPLLDESFSISVEGSAVPGTIIELQSLRLPQMYVGKSMTVTMKGSIHLQSSYRDVKGITATGLWLNSEDAYEAGPFTLNKEDDQIFSGDINESFSLTVTDSRDVKIGIKFLKFEGAWDGGTMELVEESGKVIFDEGFTIRIQSE